MFKVFRAAFDWLGRLTTVQALIHTEFVRTLLLPTVWTVLVAAGGYVGNVPIMWIMIACALTFMATIQAILRVDELRERKSPENKLSYVPVFQMDLNEAQMPAQGNRQQRRGAEARRMPRELRSPTQFSPQVPRLLEKGQLGIEITN